MRTQPRADDTDGTLMSPLWLQASGPSLSAFTIVTRPDLRYTINLFDDWATEPTVVQSPMQTEHVFRGPGAGDWLVVSFMPKAVPGHNMLSWLQAQVLARTTV